MAAFPISEQPSERTRIAPDSGKRNFRTMGGAMRGRRAYDQTYYSITMVDELLDSSDVAAIFSQAENFPDDEHTRTIDGTSYTFVYLGDPVITGYHGNYRTVTTRVYGYKT